MSVSICNFYAPAIEGGDGGIILNYVNHCSTGGNDDIFINDF